MPRAGFSASAFLHEFLQVVAGGAQRRRQSKANSGQQGNGGRENQRAAIDADFGGSRQSDRQQAQRSVRAQRGQHDARSSADRRD